MRPRPHRLTLASTGVLCAAALAVGTATTATAAPTAPTVPKSKGDPTQALDALKREGAQAIADRQAQLTRLGARLASAPSCDADGTVAGIIAADQTGLATLGQQLAADTTLADARAHHSSIFQDFRVYLVVTPQAFATSACGHIQTATTKLTGVQSDLTARVDAAAAGGADMTAAKAALADLAAHVTSASTEASHASSTLAAIGPDHGDKTVAASNQAAVDAAHTDLQAAHTDLTTATQDARAVVDALQAAH